MNKLWHVFRYEYLRHVLRRRFVFGLLSIPILLVVMIGVAMLTVVIQSDSRPVGYVDLAGVLANPEQLESKNPIRKPLLFNPYGHEILAQDDLKAEKIQAYFVIAPSYIQNGEVRMVTMDTSPLNLTSDIKKFLLTNLASAYPQKVANRILEGPNITVETLDKSRQANYKQIFNFILPVVAGIFFIIVINTSGGYLVNALIEEKENRTMEIIVTSVSPTQLMAGKILGDLAVGLTQLIIWIIFGLVALIASFAIFPSLTGQSLDFGPLVLLLATLLPAFILVAGLMATAGATSTDSREAQQLAGLFSLPISMPYWFISMLMFSPNSPVSIALSIFPLTAPVSLTIRAAFTNIPWWQITISLALLYLSAIGAIWLAGRTFRLGMLRYGKRLTWREIFGRG